MGSLLRSGLRPATILVPAVLSLVSMGTALAADVPNYVLHVGVEKARQADVSLPLHVTGFVAAAQSRDLAFRVGGTVVARNVQAGDVVHAGEVLARLGTAELQANITAAKADEASAKASLDLAQSDLSRQSSLLDKGFTTRSAFEQATKTVDVAKAQLNIAESQLQIAKDNLSYADLKAGADGVVVSVNIEVGQVVQAGQTALTVATNGGRQAVFDVSEATISKASHETFGVFLASDPSVKAQARIAEVSPTVNSKTGTVRIKVDLLDPPARMTLGAAVTGTGKSLPVTGFLLPYSALSRVDGKPAVWVVDPATEKVSARAVTLVEYVGEKMVVSGPLKDGDLVVVAGANFLSPDLKVSYAEETH